MKKLLLTVAFLLLPLVTLAGPPDYFAARNWSESQILTRAAPTLSTEGVAMNEAAAVIFVLDAGSGKTLSGAGSLDIYLYDKWDGTNFFWTKFPNRAMTVPGGCAGQRFCVIDAYTIDGPRQAQRLLAATVGVTVSSGTTATVFANVTVSLKSSSR
jgi:hypothetical protein